LLADQLLFVYESKALYKLKQKSEVLGGYDKVERKALTF